MSNHYNTSHAFENAGEVMKMVSSPPEQPQQPNVIMTNFPLIGRLHIVKDKKGMLQIGFVFFYWIYGTFTSLFIVILPGHADGHISGVFIGVFMTISFLCLTSLIRASTLNPGRIPPESDEPLMSQQKWTFCRQCNRKRPHRAHHCRRCGQCVMRMDHHCPWINNCVGEENHWAFFLLLLYAFLLSAMSFILCMLHFWVYPKCQHCDRDAFYIKHSIWFMYLLTLLAFNMAFMMAVQLVGQHFNLVLDRTTLENMQSPPDAASMFFRSMFSAYEDLCGSSRNKMLLWFLPCRKRFNSLPKYTGSNIV